MTGFPIAFDRASPDGSMRSAQCPYAVKEIGDYLNWCHRHYALDEPDGLFVRPQLALVSRREGREIWLHVVADPAGRPWWLVIGTGTSPFYGNAGQSFWRWMWAEAHQSTKDPAAYMNAVWEQLKQSDKPVDPAHPPIELPSHSGVTVSIAPEDT